MKFPISVLHDLAKTLRGREYMSVYPAISAYSDVLIAQHTLGNRVINEDAFETLNRIPVENYMPLPYNAHHLCAAKSTIHLEGLPPVTASADFGFSELFGDGMFSPNWMVIAEGEDGKLYALAHGNQHFFEAGELIKEVAKPNARARVGHVHIGNDFVTWELCNWAAAAVIFGKTCPTNIDFIRCEEDHEQKSEALTAVNAFGEMDSILNEIANSDAFKFLCSDPESELSATVFNRIRELLPDNDLVLETIRDAERTFVANAIFEVLGIPVPEDLKMMSVATLLEKLIVVEKDTVDTDPEADELRGKLLKALKFDNMLEDLRGLPKSKRTNASIVKIIRHYNS